MFNDYESSGKHMICDIKGIKNTELLNSCEGLHNLLRQICSAHNFNILDVVEYKFTPIGCSILFLLSESHISIHTFPEKNHLSLDIYTCRKYDNNDEYNKMYSYILKNLDASSDSVCNIIDRYF
jgi:S-adenosylmethionine decarboxylase proenzyme